MQKMSFEFLLVATLWATLVIANVGYAAADEKMTADCELHEALDANTSAKRIAQAEYNFNCLMTKFEELRKNTRIPSGTVAAFALPSCPPGWSPFKEAAGRLIVGAGVHPEGGNKDRNGVPLNRYEIAFINRKPNYTTGGEKANTLTIQEMPVHGHAYKSPKKDGGGYRGGGQSKWNLDNVERRSTETEGRGQAHNNMPPYIALYFCKKD